MGGHLQGGVPQPPVLHRAVPRRGHRCRRHRARHHGHGRPPGGGDGPAAVRRGRRTRHPPRRRRRRPRRRRIRQLARPAEHRRRDRVRRFLRGQPAGQCALRRGPAQGGSAPGVRVRTGNKIILFGARTGLDGIGGVSVLASDTFGGDESGAPGRKKLPSVQVGDPFMEKVLIECCLELYAQNLVVGIQDLGGAGLSCATSELASAGDGGMRIELDTVPLRAPTCRLRRSCPASRRSACARS